VNAPRLSPREAYARWTAACSAAGWRGEPVPERVPVAAALGRVTADPVLARWPSPRCDCAAMDGIAISGPGPAAGAASAAAADGAWTLPPTAFTWVDTGDPMPKGADTVVERERVAIRADGSAVITGPAPRGRNVRPYGEDFPAGELLIPAGRRLRPADLGAAAAAGHATLRTARQPAVAIIPTGDEIRPVGAPLRHGDIVDSNSIMLAARATRAAARVLAGDVQPDDTDKIAASVRSAALAADLVLVLAGSSAGRDDHTAAVLDQVGGLTAHGVAVRPGHPVLLGYAKAESAAGVVPVIGVPGYPLAAAVIFELFALPLLAALQGLEDPDPAGAPRQALLGCDWASAPDVEEWVPVALTPREASPGLEATPCPGHGAGAISRLVRADAWWPVPLGQGRFTRGALIEVREFRDIS
jgi:putative molybdopterin biosynthesis protein